MPFNYSDSKQKNRFFLCNRYAKLFVNNRREKNSNWISNYF